MGHDTHVAYRVTSQNSLRHASQWCDNLPEALAYLARQQQLSCWESWGLVPVLTQEDERALSGVETPSVVAVPQLALFAYAETRGIPWPPTHRMLTYAVTRAMQHGWRGMGWAWVVRLLRGYAALQAEEAAWYVYTYGSEPSRGTLRSCRCARGPQTH